MLKLPVRPLQELALTITEQFRGAVQPEQIPDVLETEQEPPQSEMISYEKEIPQLSVGFIQFTVNEDKLSSVTVTSMGGRGGAVGSVNSNTRVTRMHDLFTCYSQGIISDNHGNISCTYYSFSIHIGTDIY